MWLFVHKNKVFLFLIAILALSFFLRSYHFGDWLHFELDQARDAKVTDLAFQGSFWDLPLLGPKAGGTFLRLAPGFYYLQYASGLIFGASPIGIAWFVVITSALSTAFLYLFLRRGFTGSVSLGLTLLSAVSVYLVMYGRFAWNPNLIPFFTLVGFYALLRSVDHETTYRSRWFILATASLAAATQFHFLAFLAVPTITVLFLLLKRPHFKLMTWAGALGIALVLYSPMIMNEIATNGTNTKEFFGAITEKSTKEDHNLIEKSIRNISEFSLANVVILSGYEGATFPSVLVNEKEWGTVCDKRCDQGKGYGVAGVLFVLLGSLSLVLGWWRARTKAISDFYLLSILWFLVSLVLFLPLAYAIAPRFYLLCVPLCFVLLGSLLQQSPLSRKSRQIIFWGVLGLLITSNLFFLYQRFGELRRAGNEPVTSRPDRILKERVRVTYEQQLALASYFKKRSVETGYPIYLTSEPQYKRSIKYLMERENIQMGSFSIDNLYREGLYYMVLRTEGNLESNYQKYLTVYDLKQVLPFGTLSVIELVPKEATLKGLRQDLSVLPKKDDSKAPPRYTWREFFAPGSGVLDVDEDPDEVLNDN